MKYLKSLSTHPYTKKLLKTIPTLEDERDRLDTIEGIVPSITEFQLNKCRFANRCTEKIEICNTTCPNIRNIDQSLVRCHLYQSQSGENIKNNVLEVKKYYELKTGLFQKRQYVKTVDDVTFSIEEGQTFGLVGESGCGKSTIGKTIVRLENVTCGEIKICGENITHIKVKKLREARQNFQMIFQDPYASLNPMQMVGNIIAEPLHNYRK